MQDRFEPAASGRAAWSTSLSLLGLFMALAAPVRSASAQEPTIPEQLRGEDDPVAELKRLFQEVERKLEEIDIRLADAGAGEVPLGEVEDSGLDKLLRDSQDRSAEAVAGIDRILEIAQSMGSSMGSGMGQPQPGQEGQSPLDQERDRGPKEREETPEGPGKKPEPGQDKEDPSTDGQPKSPKDSKEKGENRPGEPRRDEAGPPTPPGDDEAQWGFLPARMREKFRNQGRDDLPLRYRDWIDSYYKRLNTGGR